MTLFNYAGVAISFVLGPLVVGGGGGGGGNGSSHHNHSADGEGQYYSSAYKHQLSDGGESWGPGTSGSARARTFHYDGNTGGSEYGGTLLGNGTSNRLAFPQVAYCCFFVLLSCRSYLTEVFILFFINVHNAKWHPHMSGL